MSPPIAQMLTWPCACFDLHGLRTFHLHCFLVYPSQVECEGISCPRPYVSGLRGPPSGNSAPAPFGSGFSAPTNGKCPVSKPWENEQSVVKKLAQHKLAAFEDAAGWFYMNFKVEMQRQWSWQASVAAGWLPDNLSHLPPGYFSACKGHSANPWSSSVVGDLPRFNAVPSSRSSSPVVLLMAVGLISLIGAAVLLKFALHILTRSSGQVQGLALPLALPAKSLELPPRLLTLARKTQGRKPGGLGALGLKQRVSSRQLAALAFPLMSQQNKIEEAPDEEIIFDTSTCCALLTRDQLAAAAATALLRPHTVEVEAERLKRSRPAPQ